ncbi:hypothetical protein FOL47_004255 [Perkinsus chesapeaki]|uniref:Uncharacterized protein n=2 Tax=Alveolata TaxID=33630 RepID=A0A7J6M3M0_PERCH|nr:hypothetical protein FOL47_004255 [Perkinsus chesapeaki]
MCDFDSCLAKVGLGTHPQLGGGQHVDLKAVGRRKRTRRELRAPLEVNDQDGLEVFGEEGQLWSESIGALPRTETHCLTGRFECLYTEHVTQKRKRFHEGFIVLQQEAGVSLFSMDSDDAIDSIIWSYTLRRDWNKAKAAAATLEMLLQRHIVRVEFGTGMGGTVHTTGSSGINARARGSVNVGIVSADMFRSAAAIESSAFGGIGRASLDSGSGRSFGPVEDGEFEAILRRAKAEAMPQQEDDRAPLLLQPSKVAPRAFPLTNAAQEATEKKRAIPEFPAYCPPSTPFDLLDLDFAVPSKDALVPAISSSCTPSPISSLHSYALHYLDVFYKAIYSSVKELSVGVSRRAADGTVAGLKRCPLSSTCKLKITDKGDARLYFPEHSVAATRKKRGGGARVFLKSSSVREKASHVDTPDVFVLLVKGTWAVYATAWRGMNPQGLLQVKPLTEATKKLQEGLVVGSTLSCERLHSIAGISQRLQYIETLRSLLGAKKEDTSDSENDFFNAGLASRAHLDPTGSCCTSLCLLGGQGSHRLLGHSLSLPGAVDLDACMTATTEKFPGLNSEQVAVLERVKDWFSTATAEPLLVVQGVFGSGKTTVLAAIVALLYEILVESLGPVVPVAHRRVGLLALTNVAVDNVLLKLQSRGFEDFVRLGVYDRIAASIRDRFYARTQSRAQKEGPQGLSVLEWKARSVVASTLAAAADIAPGVPCPFVVIDECGQVTEPSLMLPLMRSLRPVRIIMFGDPKQLPPPPDECPIKAPSGSASILQLVTERQHASRRGRALIRQQHLRTQYRCHPDIAAICSTLFYNCQVLTEYRAPATGAPLPGMSAVIAFQHRSSSAPLRKGDSLYNPEEADIIAGLVQRLTGRTRDICVICMYRAMVQEIKDRITQPITVATVDSFQGSEASIVIIALTYQRAQRTGFGFFISDPQRANVAISRARDHLVVVGHETAFNRSSTRVWPFVYEKAQDSSPRASSTIEKYLTVSDTPRSLAIRYRPEELREPNTSAALARGGPCSCPSCQQSSNSRAYNVTSACPVLRLSLEFGLEDPLATSPDEPARGYLWLLSRLVQARARCPVSVPEVVFFRNGIPFRFFAMGGEKGSILTMTVKRRDNVSEMRIGELLKTLYRLERKRYGQSEAYIARAFSSDINAADEKFSRVGRVREKTCEPFKDCEAVLLIRYIDGAVRLLRSMVLQRRTNRTAWLDVAWFSTRPYRDENSSFPGGRRSTPISYRFFKPGAEAVVTIGSGGGDDVQEQLPSPLEGMNARALYLPEKAQFSERVRRSVMRIADLLSPQWRLWGGFFEFEFDALTDRVWLVSASHLKVEKSVSPFETLPEVKLEAEEDQTDEEAIEQEWDVVSGPEEIEAWLGSREAELGKLVARWNYEVQEERDRREERLMKEFTADGDTSITESRPHSSEGLAKRQSVTTQVAEISKLWGKEDLVPMPHILHRYRDCTSKMEAFASRHLTNGDRDIGGESLLVASESSNAEFSGQDYTMPQFPLRLASVLGFRALDPPQDTLEIPEPPRTRRRCLSGSLSSWVEVQYANERYQSIPPYRESFQNPSWIPAHTIEVEPVPAEASCCWAPNLGMKTPNPSQWILAKIYYPLFHQMLLPPEYLTHTVSLRYIHEDDIISVTTSSIDPDSLLTEESFSIVDDSDDSDWEEL